ncbi:MAG: DUF1573 domain-containing protein [Ferruginibacter sp.]
MKKLLFSLSALVLSAGVFAQAKADDLGKFKSETIDFGKIQQSNPQSANFIVVNTGSKDLLIEQANPTCGCTISDFTKTPIKPGATGEIKATYNAAALGAFEKHLTVKFAGAEDMKSITIKGEVLSPEDYAKLKGGSAPSASVKTAVSGTSVKTAAPATSVKSVTKKNGKKTKVKTKTVAS